MSEDGTARSEQISQREPVVIKRPEPENVQKLGQNLKSKPINKQAGCPKISRDHRGLFIYKGQVGVKVEVSGGVISLSNTAEKGIV